MSTLKVNTIQTVNGTGNITASNTIVGNLTGNLTGNSTVGGTLGVTGVLTPSAGIAIPNGQGIDFSAYANAAGMTSELLDDYEEGTWTPSVGGTTVTYTNQNGKYTKVGRMVFIWFYLQIDSIGNGETNEIQGLPFTPATSNQFIGAAYYGSIANNTYSLHFNVRADSTLRSELKTSLGADMAAGSSWAASGATAIASGWYYT